jgi:sulfate adenylyltransferase subunit 2
VRDDERLPLREGEQVTMQRVRFRTLGCWPLTAAVRSNAGDLESVIEETLSARVSERQGRLIDHDDAGGMERKKQEGYF